MRPLTVLRWLVVTLLAAAPVHAQVARGLGTPTPVQRAILNGDEAHTGLRPRDALDFFLEAIATDATSYDAHWRASREALSLGILASSDDVRKRWVEAAVEHARVATTLSPQRVEGHARLALSLWEEAQGRTAGLRARRSDELLAEAERTLALDPSNATAHRVMGEWNADVMRLSAVSRWTIRKLVGGDAIDAASWEVAEQHLRLSIAENPAGLATYLGLGRMLIDSGREDEGRAMLREILERPSVEPEDPLIKQTAQSLLGLS